MKDIHVGMLLGATLTFIIVVVMGVFTPGFSLTSALFLNPVVALLCVIVIVLTIRSSD